jgi:N-acetylglucosaminyl-diphospho-decaprenol L-rhamnosyltransferase
MQNDLEMSMSLVTDKLSFSGGLPGIVEAASYNGEDKSALTAPELSIICVNWNSLDYLLNCIASIYDQTPRTSFEVIVVDNASPEGGIESIADRFPLVRIVKSDKNLGFAGANNLGFMKSVGRYILLLNPDTELVGPAIETMLGQIKSLPDAGVVGCKLLNTDLSLSTCSIQKFPTILNQLFNVEWLRLRYPAFPLWDIEPLFCDAPGATKVDVIPGACMMLRRNIFERAGLLSEDYFMYAEDIDLNYKLRRLGFSSYYVGQAEIIHHGGRSSSKREISQWSTVMTYQAMMLFYRKTKGPIYGAAYRIAMGVSASLRLVFLAVWFPFGDKTNIRYVCAKWNTVLKWALGVTKMCTGR